MTSLFRGIIINKCFDIFRSDFGFVEIESEPAEGWIRTCEIQQRHVELIFPKREEGGGREGARHQEEGERCPAENHKGFSLQGTTDTNSALCLGH